MIDRYDIGFINDFGGGDTNWWADYLRAEVERANDFHADIHEQSDARIAALRAEFDQIVLECFEVVSTTDVDQNGDHIERRVPKHHLMADRIAALEAENERLRKALIEACTRMKNARSACESNQVIDKDVHGTLTRGMFEIAEALGE